MGYVLLEGCPRCGAYPVRPSGVRGPLERLRAHVTGKQPFSCEACRWRGWAHESWDRRQRDQPPPGNRYRRRTDRHG